MEQIALRRVVEYTLEDDGTYAFEFPPSVCFGIVVSGGIVMSAICKAAADFVERSPRTTHFKSMLDISTHFYRPVLPSPKKTTVEFKVSNVNKIGVTMHVQVTQGKVCTIGYATMGVIAPNTFKGVTCELSPAPLPTTIEKLEDDTADNWIPYHNPFANAGNRSVVTYLKYHLNPTLRSSNFTDHWLTPAWKDDGHPDGAVWTNELVHFLADSGGALWMDPVSRAKLHNENMKIAYLQREARREGKSDNVEGSSQSLPYMATSLFMTTAIKKLLPPRGIKWVFLRIMTAGHANNRIDLYVIIMDAEGDVIATSKQVMMLIPLSGKQARL